MISRRCPLCLKALRKNYDQDLECPTKILFTCAAKDSSGLNICWASHYVTDPIFNLTYVDLPPYRLVLNEEEMLVAHFKGVAGMQFETLFHLPLIRINKKNIRLLKKRIKRLVIFT